jgi:cyclophilin family peptidyl-prolyl cis-trans isomerase
MRFPSKIILFFCFLSLSVSAQIVRMETVLGNIDIELRPDVAPNTVTNFLNYVNDGDYDKSYIHRSVQNFIIQGGGFNFINGVSGSVPADPPVVNEFNLSNVRGTIAMAKLADNPNSATNQWFFNTVNNSENLDNQNGGFTVFGSVINGMDVVDAIAALQVWNAGGALNSIPLVNYSGSGTIENDLVLLTNVFVLDEVLNINSGLNGAWFNPDTSGQGIMLEILPTLDSVFMAWFTHDTQAPMDTAVVGFAGNRWMTSLGSIDHETNTVTFDLIVTSDGLFDNNKTVTNSLPNTVGTLTISFIDCSNATATYNLIEQELSGTFPLVRVAVDNVGLCQSLSQAAQ